MLSDAVLAIGDPAFTKILFERLRQSAAVQAMTIRRQADGAPAVTLASEGDAAHARTGDEHPLAPIGQPPAWNARRTVDVIFTVAEGAQGRVTILVRQSAATLAITLVQAVSEALLEPGRRFLMDHADLLASVVERHFELCPPVAGHSLAGWTERLRALPNGKQLSVREALVCAHILQGGSNEAIGVQLGISRHSVVTYRRRAYAKLNINSQTDLFANLIPQGGAKADYAEESDLDSPQQAIRVLLERYHRALNPLDIAMGQTIWHQDGLAIYEGYFEGTGHDFWNWIAANYPDRSGQLNRAGDPQMAVQGSQASTETPCCTVRLLRQGRQYQLLTHRGRYSDRWTHRNGRWGLENRRYIRDFGFVHDLTASHFEGAAAAPPSPGALQAVLAAQMEAILPPGRPPASPH